jgi:hypothetical protein
VSRWSKRAGRRKPSSPNAALLNQPLLGVSAGKDDEHVIGGALDLGDARGTADAADRERALLRSVVSRRAARSSAAERAAPDP